MSFTRSGGTAPAFSFPIGTGTFTDVNASNAVFTSNVYSSFYTGDGGGLTNVTASIPSTFANLVVSNSVTTTNVFATIYTGDGGLLSNLTGAVTGNTLSNLNASNLAFGVVNSALILGNTLSNLNASNLAFGVVNSALILGNTLSNVQFSNVSGFQSNTSSNLNASNLAFGVVNSALILGNTLSNLNASNLAFGVVNSALILGNTLSNLNASNLAFGVVNSALILGNTLSNLNASNLAFGVVSSALIYGNTLSNVQFSNVSGFQSNTSSNLNASNLAFGVVSSTLIYGNLISNINSSNLTQPFANLVISNTVTTTNIVAAGFTSNASNTVFNYTTLSVPYINCTSVNVTGTATYSTLNAVNSLATGSIGFATIAGTGGTVTQLTSRNTGVTLDKPCGRIILFSSVILSQASNTFTLTNSYIAASDLVLVNHESGQTLGAYTLATNPSAGSVDVTMRNVSGGTLTAGAPTLQFVVIKSTSA